MAKLTRKELFNATIALIQNDETDVSVSDVVDFLNREVEKIDNKKSTSKPTKTQLENVGIKETILKVLSEVGSPMTVTELTKDSRLSMYSGQKISALLTQLKKSGEVVNVHEKKVSYFSLAE